MLSPLLPDSSRPRVRWHQLHGSAASLLLAEAAASASVPLLVIAADTRELDRLRGEIAFFSSGALPVLALPDWEVLPYDIFSPHPDIVSERLQTLAALPTLTRGILLVTAETLALRLPPLTYVGGRSFSLQVGDTLALEAFRLRLTESGYASVGQVGAPGEYALRGSLLDVFPMGADAPLRIDLFDDQIEAIRRFDPLTQRSGEALQSVRLLPARELPLDGDAVRAFRRRWRTRFEGDPTRSVIYRGVSDGLAPAGIEFYLPLFFDSTATLFDYLPPNCVQVADDGLEAAVHATATSIAARYEERRHDIERPLLAPDELYLGPEELLADLGARPMIELRRFKTEQPDDATQRHYPTQAPRELRLDLRADEPLAPLRALLREFPGRALLAVDSPGRREVIGELLRGAGIETRVFDGWAEFLASDAPLGIAIAPEMAGLQINEPPLLVLPEAALFGSRARQERRRRKSASDPNAILRDIQSLTAGAPVVHETYGVGRYVGLQSLTVGDQAGEFVVLEYQDGDRLYVPVHALHLISRYTGAAPESAPLHKLGTDQWSKARRKAAEKIRDVAAELLDLYARRKARSARPLAVGDLEYQSFANAFPFEETADQAEAISKVLQDLAGSQPMDRIVCGDVGFGKTEVAMRAAFVAVQAGKQVAVLVPTTLLAQQHYNNFRDRFADWPVRTEVLSRFRTGKEVDAVTAAIESGGVDIVIATHRLLHAQVRFRDLGLIIIDEEHRFGVRDKEKLKALRSEVHVLTLTATPIPRTLNMALGGLRELSLITTPPAERLAIKTFVTEWHDASLREAILRELRRGGQVYFVHNEIRDIEKIAGEIQKLVPEASVRVGHGQMRERELEQLMVDFYHRRFNILLCTTIIESGIDVPTANTIIINRADRFGLAQLHQLRGRVGRSHHRAYAYLITPPRKALGQDALKRLEALESLEDLGAGFVLATHDLEIRGAGELLGEGQSGEMTEVGLAMYLDMLDRAVQALRAGREPALDAPLSGQAEVEMRVPALFPEGYVGDVHLRLSLYKRIAAAPGDAEIDDLTTEIVDRFGELPPPAANLLRIARLRVRARRLGVRRMDFGGHGGYLVFEAENSVDPKAVIRLLQDRSRRFRMDGPSKLRVTEDLDTDAERFEFVTGLLAQLQGGASAIMAP
jgi:transcription-repair coupling factor (superfamily II helicase)